MSSANEGGAGARGMRYDGSAAGVSGEGRDVLRDCAVVLGGVTEATEDGRDGNSWESLSDPPDVFLRASGGRAWAPIAGEPARRAVGTVSEKGPLVVVGEPIWRGDGTPAMLVAGLAIAMRRAWCKSRSLRFTSRGSHML